MDRRSKHRRRHARAAVRWPVTVISGSETLHGLTENISRGGALLLLPQELSEHVSIRLAIEVPDCQDVITAKANVVRSQAVPKDAPKHLLHAVGVEFAKISEGSLKFFSGNLAPEWEKDINEMEDAMPAGRTMSSSIFSYLTTALLVIVVVFAAFTIFRMKGEAVLSTQRMTRLNDKLVQIDAQLQNLSAEVSALKKMQEDAKIASATPQSESTKKADEPAAVHVEETPKVQAGAAPAKNVDGHASQAHRAEIAVSAGARAAERPVVHSISVYYRVKPGDNLFRIGLKNNVTAEQLRKLNNLPGDYAIKPGQQLRVR